MAVESTWDDMKAVAYLLGKKRASATAINEAFMVAATRKVLEILLEHGQVRDESIHTVLAKAVVDLNNPFARTEGEDADIIALLYTKDCVSAKMLGKAFVTAASNGKSKLVALLRGDSRISAKVVSEAFAAAATLKDSHLMMSLFDANISADVILTAFSNAASEGRACNVKELVKLLSNKDRVPQEFRHKAFVIAAQLGHDAILRILCEGIDDYWPLAVLKEALAAAKYEGVKTSIRKVICDQLLDPKCPWAPVMKLVENEKGESTDSRVVT